MTGGLIYLKNEKGISLITLVITIVTIIILASITLGPSGGAVDESVEAKEKAEAEIDNQKIEEIITYELAQTNELIDLEIDLKRINLSDTLQVDNSGDIYGNGYTLYLAKRDIYKVEAKTGSGDYFKPYKDLFKSYVVNHSSGEYKRLVNEWKFVD